MSGSATQRLETDHNIAVYDARAEELVARYDALTFAQVHASWAHLLPTRGRALDVGAGSGRDAHALATRGLVVVAVEPAAAMRALAMRRHPHPGIEWVDDRLPGLDRVRELVASRGVGFSLVLVSAVWMHLTPDQQERALRALAGFIAPGGLLVITLRHGVFTDDPRVAFPVCAHTLRLLASAHDLAFVSLDGSPDQLGRGEISWQTVVFQRGAR